jgi:hypothetical protein
MSLIASERLKALPVRLAERTKKALLGGPRFGAQEHERRSRQEDIDALDMAHRILSVVARAPEEFSVWFKMQCGAPL